MAKKNKIPLKEMLQALDTNDFDFYSRLGADQKKEFSPWLAMRYASSAQGTSAYHYLLMVNDIVNVDFTMLKNHPELQWKLLAVCGQGNPTFHPWIPPGGKRKKNKIQKFLRERFPTLSEEEIEILQEVNSKDDLKEMARDTGMDEKEIKELFK